MEIIPSMLLAVMTSLPPAPHDGRYEPALERIRSGVAAPVTVSVPSSAATAPTLRKERMQVKISKPRDSVWEGALIGLGIGLGGGYLWANGVCGGNDDECFAIAAPVGLIIGGAIGAAAGAIVDAFHR